MTDIKTKRDPLLPPIPKEDEWEKYPRIESWRRGHLSVLKELHGNVNADLNTIANDIANNANDIANNASNIANIQHPFDMTFFPWEGTLSNGVWAANVDANQLFNGYYYNSSANQFNYIGVPVYMPKGNYAVTLVGMKGPDCANVLVRVDSNAWLSEDLYNANTVYNYIATDSVNNSLTTSAFHNVFIFVWYKNASSSSNIVRISQVSIRKIS